MNLGNQIIARILCNNNPEQIIFKDRIISGGELVKNSLTLAVSLQKLNFMQEQRVLLIMKDSPSYIYCFIALLSIGCIPVPLNPKIETDILDYILKDSRAVGAIIDQEEYSRLESTLNSTPYIDPSRIILDDTIYEPSTKASRATPLSGLIGMDDKKAIDFQYYNSKPSSIAFWQYTSGTTGMPKAVQHSQEAMLLNTDHFASNIIGINKSDRVLSIPKMFFGYGLGNSFFFPLLTGASVLLDQDWPSLEKLQKNIHSYQPTILFGVPKIYSLMLRHKEYINKDDLSSIRLFISAGAPLSKNLNMDWNKWIGKFIVNGIGCTEVGHIFLCHTPDSIVPELSGWPVPGYKVRITDLENPEKEVPAGNIGELCVMSPYELGKYWENHSSNNRKFKHGWYYSGDLCRIDETGGYVFMGRKDNLFKINGRWINPEEIEARIMSLFSIEECALIDVEENDGLSIPVLFVVKRPEGLIDDEEMIHELSKHISSYKLPRQIFHINDLPKNANGKISRNVLRKLYTTTYQNIFNKIKELK
jgi:acyl-coenzyme A synthetase/AMP-(fatty) acid ligase